MKKEIYLIFLKGFLPYKKILKNQNIEIVHCHNATLLSWLGYHQNYQEQK